MVDDGKLCSGWSDISVGSISVARAPGLDISMTVASGIIISMVGT